MPAHRTLVTLSIAFLLAVTGCSDPAAELNAAVATTISPTGGRAAAAQEMAAKIRAGTLKLSLAMERANTMLDEVAAGKTKSADATAFAGAVLDTATMIEDLLPTQGEMELFWINVGRLAFRAAEESHAADRIPEAMTLVFAGPQRWQNQAYWERYSDHDGLAAIILAKNGQVAVALERLRSRAELRGVALEVYELLTRPQ